MLNRQWQLKNYPEGQLQADHFILAETPVPDIVQGEVLVRNRLLAIGPAVRAWMKGRTYRDRVELNMMIPGKAVGEIIRSKAPGWTAGDIVDGELGWQEFAAVSPDKLWKRDSSVPLETLASSLGVSGLTAYVGLMEIGQPKPGETVLVSAAAGGVGTHAIQIAKLNGCRVVGVAGGREKCDWVLREFGIDAMVDYKARDFPDALGEACPDGVDVYFDNTGGAILEAALDLANIHARIVCCGAVANYDMSAAAPGPSGVPQVLVVKRIRMEGFLFGDNRNRFPEAESVLLGWICDGRMKSRNYVVEGFENAPKALIDLLAGRNSGKVLVRI